MDRRLRQRCKQGASINTVSMLGMPTIKLLFIELLFITPTHPKVTVSALNIPGFTSVSEYLDSAWSFAHHERNGSCGNPHFTENETPVTGLYEFNFTNHNEPTTTSTPFSKALQRGSETMILKIEYSLNETVSTVGGQQLPLDALKPDTSCAGRCGQDTSFPCSCNERCVVYKTCCKDMTDTCPNHYSQAIEKYSHLLSASVRCDALSAVLMVESCPPSTPEQLRSIQENVRSSTDASPMPLEIDQFSNIVLAAPVTDHDNGIIYANASVYDCNARKHKDFFSKVSKPWKVQIGTKSQTSPNKIIGMQKDLDVSTYSYVPPASQPTCAGSLCYNNWIYSCIAEFSTEMRFDQLTCNTTVVEFYKMRNALRDLASTGFESTYLCAICLARYQSLLDEGKRFYLSGFKVLMSLSENQKFVVYDLHDDWRNVPKPFPWWSWKCSIQEGETQDPASDECRAVICDSRFLLTPDGLCRKAVEAEVTIQQEILFRGRKCAIKAEKFADAFTCILNVSYNLKATGTPFRFYNKGYRQESNSSLTAFRMEMYFDIERFENNIVHLFNMYTKLFPALLAFGEDYCPLYDIGVKRESSHVQTKTLVSLEKSNSSNGVSRCPGLRNEATDFLCNYCFQLRNWDGNLEDTLECDMFIDLFVEADEENTEFSLQLEELECLRNAITLPLAAGACIPCFCPFLIFFVVINAAQVQSWPKAS